MVVKDKPELPDDVAGEDQGFPRAAFEEVGDDGAEVDDPDQRDEE